MKVISKNIINKLVKNIPQSLSKESILKILFLLNKINYILIPTNEDNRLLGFIFINALNPIYILEINYILKSYKDKFRFKLNKPYKEFGTILEF